MKLNRLIIATGGTGGHIYPALAVADYIKEQNPEAKILFIGTDRMESGLIPKSGYDFRKIEVKSFERGYSIKSLNKNADNFFSLVISLFQSICYLKEFKPQAILGAGGYTCGPVILAGFLTKIPTVIMEQNAIPGLTNRLLAKIVKGAALGLDISYKSFDKIKIREVTGTPVRKEIIEAKRNEGLEFFKLDPDKKTILVFGGSLGSQNINLNFVKAIRKNEEFSEELMKSAQILHSTGKRDYPIVLEEMKDLKTSYKVFEYITEMHLAYAAADLVIQRAGGVSIAEVCCRGLPSIVIPWSGAAEDHQTKNAEILSKNNAAVVITDKELNPKILTEKILYLICDKQKLKSLAENSKRLGKPDASANIVALLEKLIIQ
jgi:UDP-N-acetylglucosamine--N-acetylmuramyl-(pentapeptide) pyrophosphoryl-undecaprenol N-acetylglucosamine transferase